MNKPFVRSTTDKYVAGVCGGLAVYFGVDATIIRVVMVLISLFVQPFGWMLYPVLWALMPTDAGGPSGFNQLLGWLKSQGTQRR